MKDNIHEFHQVVDKYKISHPINKKAQDDIEKNKKSDFKRLLKKTGSYSIIFSIISSIFFGLKKFGLNITIIKSTIIFTVGSFTIIGVISTGTYVAIKHAMKTKNELKKNTPQREQTISPQSDMQKTENQDQGKIKTNSGLNSTANTFGIIPFAAENVSTALANAVSQAFNANLKIAKGAERVFDLSDSRKRSSVSNLIIGSIELLDGKYTITAKVINVKNSQILFYTSETVTSKGDIFNACKKISMQLAIKIP